MGMVFKIYGKMVMQNVQWEILLGVFGLIISIIYMHANTTSRIDNVHKEIMELIKKLK